MSILVNKSESGKCGKNHFTALYEFIFVLIRSGYLFIFYIINFTLIALFSSAANSQSNNISDNYYSGFTEIYFAESDTQDRNIYSFELGTYEGDKAAYALLRIAGITKPGTSHHEDATGLYLGGGMATAGVLTHL